MARFSYWFLDAVPCLVFTLVLVSLAVPVVNSGNTNHDVSARYYWLRPGVYFKYSVYAEDEGLIGLAKINRSAIKLRLIEKYLSQNITVIWKILDILNNYMKIEYIVVFHDPLVWNTNTEKYIEYSGDIILNWTFLVDIDTLDVYTVNPDGSRGRWVGEWPYLVHPVVSSKKTPKIICMKNATTGLPYSWYEEYQEIRVFVEEINETVQRITNGTKTFNPFEGDRVNYARKVWLVAILNPPPAERVSMFRVGNTVLTRDRLIENGREEFNIIRGEQADYNVIWETFNMIYNSDKRPVKFVVSQPITFTHPEQPNLTLAYVFAVAVDPEGDTIGLAGIGAEQEVLYDSVTGVLLFVRSDIPGLPLWLIIGLKNLLEEYMVASWSGNYIVLKLIETNIFQDMYTSGEIKDTNLQEDEQELWVIAMVLAVFIGVSTYILYRRKQLSNKG